MLKPVLFIKESYRVSSGILQKADLDKTEVIIIDGYVILDDTGKPGLGGHLYEFLKRKIPVIGVAKTNFANNARHKREVYRGESVRPLYVTTLGMDLDLACGYIKNMHGVFRIPTMLKKLDTLTKE